MGDEEEPHYVDKSEESNVTLKNTKLINVKEKPLHTDLKVFFIVREQAALGCDRIIGLQI